MGGVLNWRDNTPIEAMTATNRLARICHQRTAAISIFALGLIWLFAAYVRFDVSNSHTLIETSPNVTETSPALKDEAVKCDDFPTEGVQIIVKTGANEIYKKLPTQLLTSLRCYSQDQVIIFSDLEQEVGNRHVYDVLANVTQSVKESPQFEYYRTVQKLRKEGGDMSDFPVKDNAAWNLDKFKFLHMLEKTWKMRPGKDWYVFIEADTYLVRTNLFPFLARLNPKELLYMGAATSVAGENFAHGGSGIILSGATLKRYADGDEGVAARWDEKLMNEFYYGDHALERALKAKGVELTGKWPILQGETPATLPFGGKYYTHWCQAVVTLHHMGADEGNRLWQFEQRRKDHKQPLLMHEIYENLIHEYMVEERDEWDNHSDGKIYCAPEVPGDRSKEADKQEAEKQEAQKKEAENQTEAEKVAHLSFANCRVACELDAECYQFVYKTTKKECIFHYTFRLGAKRGDDEEKGYKSGWVLKKINKFRAEKTCAKADFG